MRTKKNEENKEIQEIAKYSAKDSGITINQDYNGLFKDANKLYKQKKA